MKWLNCVKTKVLLFVFVAAIMLSSSSAKADFVICDPKPVDEAINHEHTTNVQGCSFLHDGLKLYFSASRDPSNSAAREIWVAERESQDAPWGEAVNLGPNVNGPGGMEIEPSISPDDLELYFWRDGGWRSTRASTDEPWGPAAPYTGPYPDDFSPDGLTKYIWGASSLGGYGGNDIWMATRATLNDPWSELVNLGPNINDSGNQGAPSISNDGLALFFQTMQPWRIWMSFRATTEDEWGPAVQLGPEVNGYGWVAYPEISPDGSTLYFDSSSREGLSERFWQVSIKPIVDFNSDGFVDLIDLIMLTDNWGTDDSLYDIGPMPWGDGVVDAYDVLVLAEYMVQDTTGLDDVNNF